LIFVISMAAGLILTGICGWLFAADLKANAKVSHDYQSDANMFNRLQGKPLFPSEANIAHATNDTSRLQALRAELRGKFAPFPPPPKEDEKGFSSYLEDTISELKAKAAEDAVILPDGESFAFTDQRNKLKYPAENIQPWMQQLAEIKALCDILFSAKINSIVSFRRVPVTTNDLFTTQTDYLPTRIMTTPLGTVTPYKIEFRGFTRELADVMKGLAESSNCFVINNMVVKLAGLREGEQNQSENQPVATPPPVTPPPPSRRGTTTTPGRRGTGATPGQNPGTTPTPPTPPTPPNTRGRGRRSGAAAGMGGMEGMAGLGPAAPIFVAAPVPTVPPAAGGAAVPPARGAAPAGGRGPAATPAPGTSASSGSGSFVPGTVLREQLLLIMISVEVVKFN